MQKPFDIPAFDIFEVFRLIGKTDNSSAFNTQTMETITTSIIYALESAWFFRITQITTLNVLANTLHLFKSKFENINCRNALMRSVCYATDYITDNEIQLFALQCLKKIVESYYQFMGPYMNKAIIQIICKNFQGGASFVRLEGMKLFISICEHEKKLATLSQEIRDTEHLPDQNDVSQDYIHNARATLAPKLMDSLIFQDEQTENNAKEMLLDCVKEFFTICDNGDVMQIVFSFINDNILSKDSRRREGALRAFFLLVECVNARTLKLFINQKVLTDRTDLLMNQNVDIHTRIMTVEVFARIFENFPEALKDMKIDTIFEAFLLNLGSDPHLTSGVCITLNEMTKASQIERLNQTEAISIYDKTLRAMLKVLVIGVSEDAKINAMKTIASLIDNIGKHFDFYIELVRPTLLIALKAHHHLKVCLTAIQLVGQIARCTKFCLLNCGPMLSVFYQHLKSEGVHRKLKSEIIRVLRDVLLFSMNIREMNQNRTLGKLHNFYHQSIALQSSLRPHGSAYKSLIELVEKQNVSALRIKTMQSIDDKIKIFENSELPDTAMKHCIDALVSSFQRFGSTFQKYDNQFIAALSVLNLSAK